MYKKVYECYQRVLEHNKDLSDRECRQVVADVLDIDIGDVDVAISKVLREAEESDEFF